jgi:hypothetical protein
MGNLVCRIELDKKKGMVLSVENSDGKILQTIVMDGTQIASTVKGSDRTSTIIQKEDGIHIECQTFSLAAETIKCVSRQETIHESGQGFTIRSQADFNVFAQGQAIYKAMNSSLESSAETEVKGLRLKFSGDSSAEMKGPRITVEATGMMELKSGGLTTLQGSMVNIKGIVNLG